MTTLSHTHLGRTLSAMVGALLLSTLCLSAALAPAAPVHTARIA